MREKQKNANANAMMMREVGEEKEKKERVVCESGVAVAVERNALMQEQKVWGNDLYLNQEEFAAMMVVMMMMIVVVEKKDGHHQIAILQKQIILKNWQVELFL